MNPSAHAPDAVPPTQVALLRMLYGAQTAQAIYVAAKLGIADLLGDKQKDVVDIAVSAGVDSNVLRRLMRFLASHDLLVESDDGLFGLTDSGQLLRSDRVDSLQQRAIFNAEVLFPLWGELLHSVTTGQSAATKAFGTPLYEHLAAHPETRALFDATMASAARFRHGPALAACDFSRFSTIVDVGGGNGALLISILEAYPQLRGIVFDYPLSAEAAQRNIEAAGLADRCSAIAGDAFQTVPADGDAYILSNFLIDMTDDRARSVLARCRSAMGEGGTLLIVEWVIPTASEARGSYRAWDTASMDMIMLAIGGSSGGRVRKADEFQRLLEASGFELLRILETPAAVRVIEAIPACR